MNWSEFLQDIEKTLKQKEFQKESDKLVWKYIQKRPGGVLKVTANGQSRTIPQPDHIVEARVSLNSAEISGADTIQALFEVFENNTILMEYEEVFLDLTTFYQRLSEVF